MHEVKTSETDVVIVGAGPVGLTLAMDLALRRIKVVVLELRHRGEPPSVKCNHVAARSMEIFRRLGVAAKVRDAGLPEDFPHDIAFRTTMTGTELTRVLIPSRRDRYTDKRGPDADWPTPEPPHRINQIYLEPILFEHALSIDGLEILNRTGFDSFSQTDEGVTIAASDVDSKERLSISARYLVGCDGGRSQVRHQIGSKLVGDPVVQRVQSTYIRAPALLTGIQGLPAWGNMSLNPRRSGTVYAIDGRETWLIHNYLKDDEPDFDSVDRDWAIRSILGVGTDFKYEVISNEDWYGRRLVADRFRDRNVFICGDAAHLWVPYAGYGMNAGIADAANLAWLLAARLHGWAEEGILDAYEAERLPITEQVSHFAMNHAAATARQRRAVPSQIEDDSPEGQRARDDLGRATYDLNVQQYCCAGLNFGYFYDASPTICYDGAIQPEYSMGTFTQSTVPGCRTPHIWLAGERSLYDELGPDYTLLRLDANLDVEPLLDAARRASVPMKLIDIAPDEAIDVYDYPLVLVRSDQHIAWRGREQPDDPDLLVRVIRGVSGRPLEL
jgi:2-polyprenyl-6-methoxyphenol hydroxylase-like FAD-dependent oxidoreductase